MQGYWSTDSESLLRTFVKDQSKMNDLMEGRANNGLPNKALLKEVVLTLLALKVL